MRYRLLFAALFALCMAAALHLLGQAQAHRAALPLRARYIAVQAAPPAEAAQEAETPAAPLPARQDTPAPREGRAAEAPALTLPYYRSAWQAFHLQGSAG